MSINCVSFRGGETAGSPAYQRNVAFQGGESTGSVAYRSMAFRGGETTVSPANNDELTSKLAEVPHEQLGESVNFKASNYYYYDKPQKKKSKVIPTILCTIGLVGASIVGLGYVHKTKAIDKISNEKIREFLSKGEGVTKQCHQWLTSTKETSVNIWEKFKNILGKK